MKKSVSDRNDGLVEIPPFDFENSMQNRYAQQYDQKTNTVVLTSGHEKIIVLEPDVADCFPDSESVNAALRALISIASKMKQRPNIRQSALSDK